MPILERPIIPGDLVVLTVGVVVSRLCAPELIPPEKLRQIWTLRRVLQTVQLKQGARILQQKLLETRSNAEFLASFSSEALRR